MQGEWRREARAICPRESFSTAALAGIFIRTILMKPFFLTCAASFFLIAPSFAMDPSELRKIAAEAHDRENLLIELRVFPEAREYKVKAKSGKPGEKPVEGPELIATEKTVRGRYIVSESPLAGAEGKMLMVVTYDKELGVFKKWILLPDNTLSSSTGLGDIFRRCIAWTSDAMPGKEAPQTLALETHTSDKTIWKETVIEGGKVVMTGEGVATVTK